MGADLWPDEAIADDGLVPASMFGQSARVGLAAPAGWYDWATQLFPAYTSAPFAKRHAELWEWAWAIESDASPRPFVAIWSRGGAKSSSAELVTTAVGVRGKRGYGWYIRATQDSADTSVQNIAGLLESDSIARHYPLHGEREVGKWGDPRGWRRNRLRTAGGFTIDALGLDTAARGLKVDEQRPDFIILDDIDEKHDSLRVSLKKIETITTSILPAMASNGAVLAIQNLIIPNGFFARLADGRADYLSQAIVSGPHPAVSGLKIAYRADPETGTQVPTIVAGKATWAGQDLEACQHLLGNIGESAFLKECQHDVFGNKEGVALRFRDSHIEDLPDEQAKQLVASAMRSRGMSLFGGIDFGAWRFFFTLRVADSTGRLRQIAEWFSQRQGLGARAAGIDAICRHYGCPVGFPIWGDSANPQDIMEINLAFTRIRSPYRVLAVSMDSKGRGASVERLNDLLDRNAITYRRDVVASTANILATVDWQTEPGKPAIRKAPKDFATWRLGYSPSNAGAVMAESRLRYEIKEWAYPPSPEGEPQDQDPDDASADGADGIAAERYAVMSWWSATQDPNAIALPFGEDTDRTKLIGGKAITQPGNPADPLWQKFEREHRPPTRRKRVKTIQL